MLTEEAKKIREAEEAKTADGKGEEKDTGKDAAATGTTKKKGK